MLGSIERMDKPVATTDPNFAKGWVNFYRVDDYCATAYFYLDRTSSSPAPLATVPERIK